jgi:GT2 family glycosyltransferase
MNEVGLLDEEYFMHCEDLDWCMRFAKADWKVGFLPNVFVTHAKGVSSKSRPIGVLLTLHKGMDRFFDKFYRESTPAALRLIVKLGIAVSFVARAGMAFIRSAVR